MDKDMTKKGTGKLYVSDATGDMKTIKGVDTAFKKELAPRTALTFAGENLEVVEVISDTEVTVKAPVKGTKAIAALTATEKLESGESKPLGVSFKFAPHVDQGEMFATVIARLNAGGCVGIFPEGGSHDRSEFLPLKPGVAMMALGAMAQNETLDVKIIPCGLNYFHADKFRSRAVIEFGDPITVPTEAVEMYRKGGPDRRAAVGSLLDTIFKSLKSVAVTAPDYDTLMGFEKYRNDPKIQELFTRVQDYNKLLGYYGIRDHQVLKTSIGGVSALVKLVTRLLEVLCLFALAAPGAILHYPILYVSNTYAAQKAIEAKRDSSVKLEGKDVVATWKILIALVLTPACYTLYNLIFFLYLYLFSSYTFYPRALFCLVFSIVCPLFGWAAVRASEIGFDIFHSLKPLFLAIFPSSAEPLRLMRADLTARINALIEDLGPAMFGGKEEFDAVRIVKQEDVNYGESRQEKLNRGIDDSFRWEYVDPRQG
ncbi:hypothetical protein HK101_005737 [Irineochytrium annulatum]|nr:hypothetical protein HK101_005737 [Irineochytrium annulatum]